MSLLVVVPELLDSTAADLQGIRSALMRRTSRLVFRPPGLRPLPPIRYRPR
jgi:hypothetical protein